MVIITGDNPIEQLMKTREPNTGMNWVDHNRGNGYPEGNRESHAHGDVVGRVQGGAVSMADYIKHSDGDVVDDFYQSPSQVNAGNYNQPAQNANSYGPTRDQFQDKRDFKQARRNYRSATGGGFGNLAKSGMNMIGNIAQGAGQIASKIPI